MVDAAKLAATSVVNVRRGIVYVMSRVGVGARGVMKKKLWRIFTLKLWWGKQSLGYI